jgi:PHD/YefM family antitoxin component YafN of YafNO toxin-antitoxin module
MESFTPTEFRTNSSKVFNEVQANGKVIIKSKSRPEMVLMTTSKLGEMLRDAMLEMNKLGA